MKRVYVLPELIDSFIERGAIDKIILRIHETIQFLKRQDHDWGFRIIMDSKKIEEFSDYDLYDQRMLASLWVDENTIITRPKEPNNVKVYSYFIVPNLAQNCLRLTTEATHIDITEQASEHSKVLNVDDSHISIIRIHKFNPIEAPVLKVCKSISFDLMNCELFLEKYILCLFGDDLKSYELFKHHYFLFLNTFNWNTWVPSSNLAPGDSILKMLKEYYQRKNDDTHHLNWGYIMAFINGGIFNKELTIQNKKNKNVNDIFQLGMRKGNNTIFYSIDTENGNLEIYDYRGVHLNRVYGLISGLRKQERNYSISVPPHAWY